ncbi:M20 family metallopeptidase [Parasulfuritortus cantonensis]|uniref:M20 family metallopeptidase n=1 Tax=Parasulfuritortus cantonensis TaxID=2528202 RepID=UPI00197D01D9|nr:M20/M25/M40 family metallo-hydrolase [Parasulfuritortus cantonensis]
MFDVIDAWLHRHGIAATRLTDPAGRPVGLCGEIVGDRPGPRYLLDATADTAPYGDPAAWHYPPDRASIADGWLYGRGSADSKAGIAVFCHVLADLNAGRDRLAGRVAFLFDADEHTGGFAGLYAYLERFGAPAPAGVMIGYPGHDRLVTGARGFLRAGIVVHGVAAHSGASSRTGVNAIARAAALLERLAGVALPGAEAGFPLPAKLTPTAIHGGVGWAMVPDRCALHLDLRLTPTFDAAAARRLVADVVAQLDGDGAAPATEIAWQPGWPAYRLAPDQVMAATLAATAAEAFGQPVPMGLAGPSSIANYLATLDIPATAGLGVGYRAIHAPDEGVELATLVPTFLAYRNALVRLLAPPV